MTFEHCDFLHKIAHYNDKQYQKGELWPVQNQSGPVTLTLEISSIALQKHIMM